MCGRGHPPWGRFVTRRGAACGVRTAATGMIADGLATASPYTRPRARAVEGTPTLHRVCVPVPHSTTLTAPVTLT